MTTLEWCDMGVITVKHLHGVITEKSRMIHTVKMVCDYSRDHSVIVYKNFKSYSFFLKFTVELK